MGFSSRTGCATLSPPGRRPAPCWPRCRSFRPGARPGPLAAARRRCPRASSGTGWRWPIPVSWRSQSSACRRPQRCCMPPALAAARRMLANGHDVRRHRRPLRLSRRRGGGAYGQTFGRPVVITARGSDVTQLPDHAMPNRLIRWAVARADALIAVSAPLAERLVELGAPPDRVRVLRNGVDAETFRPVADRAAARAALAAGRPHPDLGRPPDRAQGP